MNYNHRELGLTSNLDVSEKRFVVLVVLPVYGAMKWGTQGRESQEKLQCLTC